MRKKNLNGELASNPTAERYLSGTNLERAGDHNQRVTLHAVRVNGPVTRTDLALKTGLTPAAIANITNRLLKSQLILNAGRMRGARGQPASKFVINPDSWFSIGLNVDRDHVTLVVLDFVGKIRARASREIHFAKPAAVRSFFRRSIGQLLAKAGIARDRLVGVGVAFPDDITRAHLPDQPADYAAWASVRIDDLIRDVLKIPVFIENDAAAAAIGEMQFGSGQRYRSFFYLLVTAALGGGVVADGAYVRGANGRSGEIGWLRARRRRRRGKSACKTSSRYRACTAASRSKDSRWRRLVGSPGSIPPPARSWIVGSAKQPRRSWTPFLRSIA